MKKSFVNLGACSRYFKVKDYLKLLIGQSKFSGPKNYSQIPVVLDKRSSKVKENIKCVQTISF